MSRKIHIAYAYRELYAIVDDEDAPLVLRYKWSAQRSQNTYYARRTTSLKHEGLVTTVMLHRQILGLTDPLIEVDHINRNGLDCRRSNLRAATESQNKHAAQKSKVSIDGYRGIQKKPNGRYTAKISVDNRQRYIGTYNTPEEAAHAYDRAAREHYGEFASLNFPEDDR